MSENEIAPLKFEKLGGTNLYECEHITNNTYPISSALPIGEHTNILLCKHCWAHTEGMALEGVIYNLLRGHLSEESRVALKEILNGRTQ